MTIGNRISTLRKQMKYSQEYVAEKLGVSRQAVSKWEKDISKPDTDNIIQLTELLGTNIDYILTGKINYNISDNSIKRKKFSREQKRKTFIWILSVLVFVITASIILVIHLCPVNWEIGACRGGYITSIYDLYCDELTDKFVDGMEYDNDKILWAEPIKGTQQGKDNGRKLFLEFDIKYEHSEYGVITQRIHFIGTRYWINKFSWSGAIIEG